MFIAWRSVTEAKNKILLLCYLSIICVCASVRGRMYVIPAKLGTSSSNHSPNAVDKCMPCDIFETTMKTKLMIVYIFVFINANVIFFSWLCIFLDC